MVENLLKVIRILEGLQQAEHLRMLNVYGRGVKPVFTGGHISLAVAFKGANVISTP